MEYGFPFELGSAVPLPGLFGTQLVYPVGLVVTWVGLLLVTLPLLGLSNRVQRWYRRPRNLWDAEPTHTRRTESSKDARSAETLEAIQERHRDIRRSRLRNYRRKVVTAPLYEELVFVAFPS